jgi:hypothetical protein
MSALVSIECHERKKIVMAGLVPAIHVLALKKDVDARHKAGHDEQERS